MTTPENSIENVISIENYLTRRLNDLAQRYRAVMGTCVEQDLKQELKEEGERHAKYMQFAKRKERDNASRG